MLKVTIAVACLAGLGVAFAVVVGSPETANAQISPKGGLCYVCENDGENPGKVCKNETFGRDGCSGWCLPEGCTCQLTGTRCSTASVPPLLR